MTTIKPGTPCFLTQLTERPEFDGRVVEVVAGPLPVQSEHPGKWYAYRSEWSAQMFPGRETLVRRCNLLPIVPPELAPPEARKRTPETVSR